MSGSTSSHPAFALPFVVRRTTRWTPISHPHFSTSTTRSPLCRSSGFACTASSSILFPSLGNGGATGDRGGVARHAPRGLADADDGHGVLVVGADLRHKEAGRFGVGPDLLDLPLFPVEAVLQIERGDPGVKFHRTAPHVILWLWRPVRYCLSHSSVRFSWLLIRANSR